MEEKGTLKYRYISMSLHGVTSQKTVIFMNMPLAYLYKTSKPETLDNSCNTLVSYSEEFFSSRPKFKDHPLSDLRDRFSNMRISS